MRRTYRLLYGLGLRPWDSVVPPEPLVAAARAAGPGRAVDLGCGTGAQARYLASLGWSVTAVDYTPRAIALARRDDPHRRVTWRIADVTVAGEVDPTGELAARCDLVLDNGCLHGIPVDRRPGWAATVRRLAAPGATLLVRAAPPAGRLERPGRPAARRIGPQGIAGVAIAALLGDGWVATPQPEGWHRFDSCTQ